MLDGNICQWRGNFILLWCQKAVGFIIQLFYIHVAVPPLLLLLVRLWLASISVIECSSCIMGNLMFIYVDVTRFVLEGTAFPHKIIDTRLITCHSMGRKTSTKKGPVSGNKIMH